jgi:hypothetical protein
MAKIDPNELCPCESGLLFKECHELKIKKQVKPKIKQKIRLKVIPEPDPDTRAVFIYGGEGTIAFQGFDTELALVCGGCSSPLAAGISSEQIKNVVIKCNKCGKFNEV